MSREMDFRMSRPKLVSMGDKVELSESTLSTLEGTMYYYTIEPALAMSNNTLKPLERLTGVVKRVEDYGSEWTVTVEVEEVGNNRHLT